MIHSSDIVKRIRELLILSGVPKGDVLEEMVDHYLSDIEQQMDQNINHQVAIQTTYQKIAKTDLSNLHKNKRTPWFLLFASIFLLFVSVLGHQYFNQEEDISTEKKEDSREENLNSAEPEGWPLIQFNAKVTSNFGLRKHPVLNTIKQHNGIDIKAKLGTAVIATGDAFVRDIGYDRNAGKFIILEHSCRFSTRYCHLSSIDVLLNETVTKGSIIGKVGSSGLSSAPHLHYEIMDEETHVDPLECLRA